MTDRQPSEVAGAVKEGGSQVASTTADQGKRTASAAADAGGQVAGAGAEGARQVAAEATTQAGEVTRQATEQARDLVEQAQTQLRDQAGTQTQRAAGGLRDLSQQVRALIEGRTDQAGVAGDAARQVAEKIEALAGRIDERGFEGTVDDVREFARRRPGLFLVGAAAAGFAAARFGRGLQTSQHQQGGAPPAGPAGPATPPGPGATAPTVESRSPATATTGPTVGGW